jgi:hypothetical protein
MTSVNVGAEGDLLTIRVDMAEVTRELGRQLAQCQESAETARKRWEESEWYLGEARARIADLEAQLQAQVEGYAELDGIHREATARLQEAQLQRDEMTRQLDELRAAHEELLRQTIQLADQLEQVRDRLPVDGAQRQIVEGEPLAAGTNGERRRASRTPRADIMVELQRPDGAVLFHGPLRDISRTGMGFACDQLANGAPELLWVTLHPDGLERPIEAIARLAWLRQDDESGNYAGGCELLDVSPGSRGAFEAVLGQPN